MKELWRRLHYHVFLDMKHCIDIQSKIIILLVGMKMINRKKFFYDAFSGHDGMTAVLIKKEKLIINGKNTIDLFSLDLKRKKQDERVIKVWRNYDAKN